jgi:eukaryotic-like serine/threonine-protein kinase
MAVGRAKKAMAVGRYELVYELAPSYLGPLWAVHSESGDGSSHVSLLRQVSLSGLDADTRVRLLEAAWQAMEIRDERIAPVADVVASDGELGVVSEYIEGQTLRALQGLASVRRTPMPVAVALRILLDVADGVTAVHRAHLEFGDEAIALFGGVSADSVIVGTNGRAFVTDLAVSSAASLIEPLGSNPDRVAYEAPEQVSSPPTADARTDVFAIGILAWELLSNRRLFIGSDKAVTQKVLVAKIPRLDEVKRRGDFDIPDGLLASVMKALERDPAARFQSIDDLATAFRDSGVAPADETVVGSYVQNLAEGVLDRMRDALKDSTGGRVELGSRVQAKQPEVPPAAPKTAVAEPSTAKPGPDKSLTDTVPIPGQKKREPGAQEAKAPSPAAPAVGMKRAVVHKPAQEGRWTEAGKPKPALGLKPRPIAFEARPRLPVQADPKARAGAADPKAAPGPEAKQGTRRATMMGVAPAAGLVQAAANAAANRKAATMGAPPVAAPEPVAPAMHRARQPTMIGIPPPAANSAPKPASISPKGQETKQAIFDSIPPGPPSSAEPTPPAAVAKKAEEEPTGQYNTHELLQQVEAMGRRSESARSADFPEPPTKPRIAIPAPAAPAAGAAPAPAPATPEPAAAAAPSPADGGWLDGPDEVTKAAPPPKHLPEPSPSPPAAKVEPVRAIPEKKAPAQVAPENVAPAQPPPMPAPAAATPAASPAKAAPANAPIPSLPPPAHVLPSQIPPPLIHDPRANRSQTARPGAPSKPSRGRNMVLGVFASIVIASASAAVGIVALGGRNPAPLEPKAEATATAVVDPAGGTPATAPAPADSPQAEPAVAQAPAETAAAPPDPATAGAAPAARPEDTGGAPKPTQGAVNVRTQPPAAQSPAAKRPPPVVKKKKSSRYVPDDI